MAHTLRRRSAHRIRVQHHFPFGSGLLHVHSPSSLPSFLIQAPKRKTVFAALLFYNIYFKCQPERKKQFSQTSALHFPLCRQAKKNITPSRKLLQFSYSSGACSLEQKPHYFMIYHHLRGSQADCKDLCQPSGTLHKQLAEECFQEKRRTWQQKKNHTGKKEKVYLMAATCAQSIMQRG